ncbi:MAG: fasciclin domain-containing protein, partial [Myroides sp.]
MRTKSNISVIVLAALAFTFSGNATAQSMKEKTVMVGGAAMYPSKIIIENA